MQNTVDHTNISELASLIGVDHTPSEVDEATKQPCGDSCAVGANGA